MNVFLLSLAYLRARALTNGLLVLLLALGVATISLLLHVGNQAQQRLSRDGQGIDLVVGAKGSPLQLVLSSVYHMDIPTGNIPAVEAARLRHHPAVKQAIPLALGDNYRGFRIVGTEGLLIDHYKAELTEGARFSRPMEVVVGARVAKESGLALGATFAGSHGLSEGGHVHADAVYTVVGVLKPTGAVIDRLILTPVESVWQVHGDGHAHHEHEDEDEHAHHEDEDEHEHEHHDEHHEHEHAHDEHEHHDHEKATAREPKPSDEITALLISYKSPVAAMSLPREINRLTSMQAASPPFETTRMLSLLGIGLDALRWCGFMFIASAVLGMLVALYQSMRERRYDVALMRVMGASRRTIVVQMLIEAALLLVLGSLLGLALSYGVMALLPVLSAQMSDLGFVPLALLPTELAVVAGVMVSGLLVAVMPALAAYRVDVSRILSKA